MGSNAFKLAWRKSREQVVLLWAGRGGH
jgi:hypothetical protein